LRSIHLTVQHEVPLINLGPIMSLDASGNGRMDLVITSSDSQSLLADVTVTHPAPADLSSTDQRLLQPLYFARHAEGRKIRRYGEAANRMHHHFSPFAFETYGASGPTFTAYLKSIAARYQHSVSWGSNTDSTDRSAIIRFWRTKISCCLQRSNAKLIISKANRIQSRSRQGPAPPGPDSLTCWTIT
jgi:hypothetical protein